MTSYERELQEINTARVLRRLRKKWDRPEYAGGPYPTAIKRQIDELIDLVVNGTSSDSQYLVGGRDTQ